MSAHLRILSARLPRPLFLPRTLCISSPLCLSSPLCISTPLISTPLCPAPPRHVACLRHIRKYTADTSRDPNDAPRAPTSTIEKVATRGKRKTIETEAETSARAGRRSRPTTPRPPSPLRNLLNTSIPILATLEQRILRAKENSTTFANIPYPYNPLSRDELTAVCAPLLDPSFSLPDHLPALSSRIITLVSPFKGSDVLLEYLATALAHHTNADFLKITNADLFHRLPSYISATAHVIDANDRPNFPVNQIPFPPGASAIVSAFRRLDRNSSPGGAPILINVSGGDEPDPTMSGGVPFPWRRVYNQGWSPRDGVFRSNIPIGSQQPSVNQGKQHPVTIMSEVFDEFLHTASEAGDRPKIIYYSDLMELLVLNDAREQLLHSLAAPLLYTKHPIVIIAPSTTTLPTHQLASPRANDNARLGPVIRLAAPFSEDEDDQDDESDPPGQDGSGLLDAAKLSYTHSPATGYVGVPVISFLPPRTPSARHALQPLLNRDRRRVVAETNLREIQAVCEASGVTFASENGGSIGSILDDRSLTRYDRIEALVAGTSAKLLEDRTLTPLEVERVIVVAAAATRRRGEGEVKVEPNLKAKAKVKAKADENGNGAPEPRWEVSMVDLARACEIVIGSAAARAVAQTNATAVPGGTGDGMEASAPPQRLSGREQKMMKQCLVGARLATRFADIGGMDKTKQTISELISLPLQRPDLFRTGVLRQSTTGLLLFGPPGTGKTMLAKAIAVESGSNFLSVNVSQLQSKWVGESEKNVKALFTLSRKIRPCVIFVDEIDALLRGRGLAMPYWAVGQVDEFMQEWDGINSEENKGVIVIGATNRPFDLDEAVLRRMPRRILVDLPDKQTRLEILRIALRGEHLAPELEESGLHEIAAKTDMYSGSDIKNLAIAAAYNAIREQDRGPGSPVRVLGMSHFQTAMKEVRASLANEMGIVKQLRDWDRVFGTREEVQGFGFM